MGALCACLLAVGCGSSSQSSATSSSATSTTATTSTTTTTVTTTPGGSDSAVSGKLGTLPQAPEATGSLPSPPASTATGAERSYLHAVFDDLQRFWRQEFNQGGVAYGPARLVLFRSATHSGCGAQSDTGPFYCPADRTVYLDLGFFALLAHHAGIGRFGQAYIVGHEIGHHLQHLLSIDQRVAVLNHQDPAGANARSVRVELQADCLAGVWAYSSESRGQLTAADLEDALKTAAFVGDDFQMRASGRVPDSALWTHGSSQQRQQWLSTGFQEGRPNACDTFGAGTA